MKKVLFLLCSVLLVLGSCGQSGNKDGYLIKGTAEGTVDGDTVFMAQTNGYLGTYLLDTAIVKGGKFEMEGTYDGADVVYLVALHQRQPAAITAIVLENADYDVKMYKDPEKNRPEVKGGQAQTLYDAYQEELEKMYNSADTVTLAYLQDSTSTSEQREKAENVLKELDKKYGEITKQAILKNIPSAFSDMLFGYSLNSLSREERDEIMAAMEKSGKQYRFYRLLKEILDTAVKEGKDTSAVEELLKW